MHCTTRTTTLACASMRHEPTPPLARRRTVARQWNGRVAHPRCLDVLCVFVLSLAEFEALALANLSHENATRLHAEHTLMAFKSAQPAAFMQALLALLAVPTAAPQSREFAAVLLRQNLLVNSTSPVWTACGGDTQRAIQQELLRLFSTERAPSLRKKITDAVAATATRISGGAPLNIASNGKGVAGAAAAAAGIKTAAVAPVPEGEQAKWDELMPTVMSLAQADAVETRQSLLDLIDKLAEFNPRILQPHLAMCKSIIMRGLKDKDMPVRHQHISDDHGRGRPSNAHIVVEQCALDDEMAHRIIGSIVFFPCILCSRVSSLLFRFACRLSAHASACFCL